MDNFDELSTNQVDNEIAKLIGWQKIRKKAGVDEYSGINPTSNLREPIPPFSKSTEAIHIAEKYVAREVGMAYIVYLGKLTATPPNPVSWANIQQAFLEPSTRAKACLVALRDVKSEKNAFEHMFVS